MSIISKETFEKFTEEEKDRVRNLYTDVSNNDASAKISFITLFGKENLKPEPKIRTWEDVEKEHPEHFSHSNAPNPMFIPSQELRDKLLKRTMATYKIATLIELGYGGMVTEEEWKSPNEKFIIKPYYQRGKLFLEKSTSCNYKYFIAFHTYEQAEEFMSYPENVKLVEQYYMI